MNIIPFPGSRTGSSRRGVEKLPTPTPERPNLAVASSNGREVDLHLGEAAWLLIVGPRPDGAYGVLDRRDTPEPGGTNRWQRLAENLGDCFALLVADAGDNPRRILAEHNIPVLTGEGGLAGLAEGLFTGGEDKMA